MIRSQQVFAILDKHMPRKRWVSCNEVFEIVEAHTKIDAADRSSAPPLSKTPKWKIVVRDVLLQWLKEGRIRRRSKS